MVPEYEVVECPNCDKQFEVKIEASSFTCPHCGQHRNVVRSENTRAFMDSQNGDCALTALSMLLLLLGVLAMIEGATDWRVRAQGSAGGELLRP